MHEMHGYEMIQSGIIGNYNIIDDNEDEEDGYDDLLEILLFK